MLRYLGRNELKIEMNLWFGLVNFMTCRSLLGYLMLKNYCYNS